MVLCVAAAALVALGVSAGTGILLLPRERALHAIAPAAQARVWLLAALLPAIASAAVMTAALAPALGWIADHCLPAGDPHAHPHLCAHHVAVWPALPLLAIAGAFSARVAAAALSLARVLRVNARARRELSDASRAADGGTRVVPLDEPQAFVLGVLRPTLYVTRGLLSAAHREHLDAVLAHENAHVHRADPLRMLLANLGLAFHLPGVAALLRTRLLHASEMAADLAAADAIGSRERVASALVALSRAQRRPPGLALAFGGCALEARVRRLLDERPGRDAPAGSTLLLALLGALIALAAQADHVHHGVERLLGVLGG
jgi:beta-lactamase regulating signal transducer with metallopeptidase domain